MPSTRRHSIPSWDYIVTGHPATRRGRREQGLTVSNGAFKRPLALTCVAASFAGAAGAGWLYREPVATFFTGATDIVARIVATVIG